MTTIEVIIPTYAWVQTPPRVRVVPAYSYMKQVGFMPTQQMIRMSFPWVSVIHSNTWHFSLKVLFHSKPWGCQDEAWSLWTEQQLSCSNCNIRDGLGCAGTADLKRGLAPHERFWFTTFNNYKNPQETPALHDVLFDVKNPKAVLDFDWRRRRIGNF